jgi:chromosome partitioning protein
MVKNRIESLRPNAKIKKTEDFTGMPRRISICNLKGGVGKTMLSTQFAFFLGAHDKKVLLVDADYQGNATSILTDYAKRIAEEAGEGDDFTPELGTKTAELYKPDLDQVTPTKITENIDLIYTEMADEDLVDCSQLPVPVAINVTKNISAIAEQYDFIIYDCPPSLGTACAAPLIASDWIIIPVEIGTSFKDSIYGINKATLNVSKVRPDIEILAYVVNRFEPTPSDEEIFAGLKNLLGSQLLDAKIQYRRCLRKAGLEHVPLWEYRNANKVTKFELVRAFDELLERMGESKLGEVLKTRKAKKTKATDNATKEGE